MNYTLESFIVFCDEMEIVNEGLSISSIKAFLKRMIMKVLNKAESWAKKIKNDRLRNMLVKCIGKLKRLFGDVEKIKESTPVEEVSKEYENISTECNKIEKEVEEIVGKDDEFEENKHEEIKENEKIQVIKRKAVGIGTKFGDVSLRNNLYYYECKINDDDYQETIWNTGLKMDAATTFNEYIKYFKEFKQMLLLPDKCMVYGMRLPIDGNFHCYYILENKRPMKREITKQLYHTSTDPNLTQLEPQWISESNFMDDDSSGKTYRIPLSGRHFDSPRVFFGVFPMNRMGYKVNRSDGQYIYKAEGITQAYIDLDGIAYGKSVYVEGTSPIKVTRVDNDE